MSLGRIVLVLSVALVACRPAVPFAEPHDGGPLADGAPDAAFVFHDAGRDAQQDAMLDAPPVDGTTTSDGGIPPGALGSWTLADAIADARSRVPAADARLVYAGGTAVRADGTIDLETRTSSTTVSGEWTIDFQSSRASAVWTFVYGRYDPGTAWPAVTMPTYVEAAEVSSPPDSPAILAAFLAEPTCHAGPDGLSELSVFQPVGVGVGGLQVRVGTSAQHATFWYVGGSFGVDATCS